MNAVAPELAYQDAWLGVRWGKELVWLTELVGVPVLPGKILGQLQPPHQHEPSVRHVGDLVVVEWTQVLRSLSKFPVC